MLGPEGWRKVRCKFKKFKVGDIKQNDAMIKRLWYTDLSRPWGPNIGPIWTGLGVPVPRVCFAFKKSTQLMLWAMGILIELWDQADTCPLFLASKKSPAAKFQVYSYIVRFPDLLWEVGRENEPPESGFFFFRGLWRQKCCFYPPIQHT